MAHETAETDLLTIDEVAARLRISRRGVERLIARRAIPVLRLTGRTHRFRWRAVEAALDKLTVKNL